MKRKDKSRPTRTDIVWIREQAALTDVFGNPLPWTHQPQRVIYLDARGERVYLSKKKSVCLSDDMDEVVQRAAKATGRSQSEIVRRCVIEQLAKKEPKHRA